MENSIFSLFISAASAANLLFCASSSRPYVVHYNVLFVVDRRKSMRRITVSVADDMHRALRLLSILEGKSFGAVVLEALDFYLRHHSAYDLDVAKKPQDDQRTSS